MRTGSGNGSNFWRRSNECDARRINFHSARKKRQTHICPWNGGIGVKQAVDWPRVAYLLKIGILAALAVLVGDMDQRREPVK